MAKYDISIRDYWRIIRKRLTIVIVAVILCTVSSYLFALFASPEPSYQATSAVKPDLILVNYGDDTHQDHRTLTQATMSATRYVRNVLFFEVPTTQNFNPQVFVDISDTLEQKFKVLEAHASQVMKTNIEDMYIIELAQASATFGGIQGRVKFAEAFAPLRLFINI